jgi:DNA-binding transcriptional LysR family regulator
MRRLTGDVDLAIFIAEATARKGTPVGALPLVWCAAPGFALPPDGETWPLIAIQAPCAIGRRAMEVLKEHGIRTKVVAEAAYLAGVVNAARAGLGVALLPSPDPRRKAWSN